TGQETRVVFRPAPANAGIRFRRVDVDGSPEIPALLAHVVSTDRGTTLGKGETRVHTVEHVLAACVAAGLDNLWIDVDGPELPIGDGSFRPFFERLQEAGVTGQGEPAGVVTIRQAINVEGVGGASYAMLPAPSFRVSATIEFDHPLVRHQYASFEV